MTHDNVLEVEKAPIPLEPVAKNRLLWCLRCPSGENLCLSHRGC